MEHLESQEPGIGIFRAPLTKGEMRSHVGSVSLLIARQLHFVFCKDDLSHLPAQASLLGFGEAMWAINDPDLTPSELGLNYELLQGTALARDLEMAYDFAYHGLHPGGEAFNSESGLSWTSRVLVDLASSHFVAELDNYTPCKGAVEALVEICETAQARIVLEPQLGWIEDCFMDWRGPSETLDGFLTFRQMSLVSGVKEASLRTMANPSRKNPLVTQQRASGTYIEASKARDWLVQRGRYVPLVNADRQGAAVDLLAEEIRDADALLERLNQRVHFLLGTDEAEQVETELRTLDPEIVARRDKEGVPYLKLEFDDRMRSSSFIRKLAKCLRIEVSHLELTVQHLQARDQLTEVERRLREARAKRTTA